MGFSIIEENDIFNFNIVEDCEHSPSQTVSYSFEVVMGSLYETYLESTLDSPKLDVTSWLDSFKGKSFEYSDFTPEQIDSLRGRPFQYSDFTEEQLAALKGPKFEFSDFTPQELDMLTGRSFQYSDFTEQQLAELKGERGAPFKFEDFTPQQLSSLKVESFDGGSATTVDLITQTLDGGNSTN